MSPKRTEPKREKRPNATKAGKRTTLHSTARSKASDKQPPVPQGRSAEKQPRPAVRAGNGEDERFPVVGLGASAGGLPALEEFFTHMPVDSGVAFVVVTHQHSGQPSLMAELLGRKTAMSVVQVRHATKLQPNHVYTTAPGFNLAILNGVLQPMEVTKGTLYMPIDYFFRCLAQDQKEYAVGIILSGTGSDGTLGLKEIKGALGMVMVQEEQTAHYAGMPHSAIATLLVDYVLPATEMPKRLVTYARGLMPGRALGAPSEEPVPEALQRIFVLLRSRAGHDFSLYKANTIRRRIERRMNVHHLDSMKGYVRFLQMNPAELDLLFKELLIGVTSFFRDPDAFDALGNVVCELLADKPDDYVVRAWVPGCSTGEEAYSIAIVLRESMDRIKRSFGVQVFGTDLDRAAVALARAGVYPAGIASDVSPQRLSRFFSREEDTYRVRDIREMVVFAPQNLIADPPFTKLDLISCRNLLIYLDTKPQKKLIPIFHYALRPQGLLFLGPSESIGSFAPLFDVVQKKWKIFRRKEVPAGSYVAELPSTPRELHVPEVVGRTLGRSAVETGVAQVASKILLRELVPPTAVVNEQGEVMHIHGRTGLFLEPAPGPQTSSNIFAMAREGLQIELSSAIRKAASTDEEVVRHGVRVKTNGDRISFDLRVRKLSEPAAARGLFLVSFDHARPVAKGEKASHPESEAKRPDRVSELERELQYSKESRQATIEELETANEELKSTNEELQSTNEELQSTNEELETSKEEMQSLNEELQTVNAELQGKIEELSRANDDMKNLLNGTDIATVFLDPDLNIKRYTEQAKQVIPLIPSDIGRPIGDLVSSLRYDRLVDDARDVLRTLIFKEMEVQGGANGANAWYLTRILPYRTTENMIDGLVITFVEISKIKALQQYQERVLEALKSSPVSLFGQDRALRFIWASSRIFGRYSEELLGKTDVEVFGAQHAKQMIEVKERVIETGSPARARLDMSLHGKPRSYDLYIEPMRGPSGEVIGVSSVVTDITPLPVTDITPLE